MGLSDNSTMFTKSSDKVIQLFSISLDQIAHLYFILVYNLLVPLSSYMLNSIQLRSMTRQKTVFISRKKNLFGPCLIYLLLSKLYTLPNHVSRFAVCSNSQQWYMYTLSYFEQYMKTRGKLNLICNQGYGAHGNILKIISINMHVLLIYVGQ